MSDLTITIKLPHGTYTAVISKDVDEIDFLAKFDTATITRCKAEQGGVLIKSEMRERGEETDEGMVFTI